VNVAPSQLATLDARLRHIASAASLLEWPLPRVRNEVERLALVRGIESVLVLVARGHGAIDVAIGERLDALSIGDRTLVLGYAGIGDYARRWELGVGEGGAARRVSGRRRVPDRRVVVRTAALYYSSAKSVLPHGRRR
jgi:hypothetical protein